VTSVSAVRYEVDGAIATITLNRPEAANAQNSELIDALDAAFDQADADDGLRVVVLAAEGKHFSAGHDLKELLAGEEHWAAMRDTPEGKLAHEQTMYFDKLVRIRDFRKITIAAVQGTCSAAGLMLASMCDLIVAADDARFSNPVLRMSGVGVELLIEPWELGPRKAKEFLFCAATFSAEEAERYGLVNRVVPRADLARAAREMADQVALVPALTAEMVKESINHMVDGMGQRESWRYHFMLHQFVSNTPTALAKVDARKQGGMDAVKREQGKTARRPQAER
jgi:enoyl-CoA hydratase